MTRNWHVRDLSQSADSLALCSYCDMCHDATVLKHNKTKLRSSSRRVVRRKRTDWRLDDPKIVRLFGRAARDGRPVCHFPGRRHGGLAGVGDRARGCRVRRAGRSVDCTARIRKESAVASSAAKKKKAWRQQAVTQRAILDMGDGVLVVAVLKWCYLFFHPSSPCSQSDTDQLNNTHLILRALASGSKQTLSQVISTVSPEQVKSCCHLVITQMESPARFSFEGRFWMLPPVLDVVCVIRPDFYQIPSSGISWLAMSKARRWIRLRFLAFRPNWTSLCGQPTAILCSYRLDIVTSYVLYWAHRSDRAQLV